MSALISILFILLVPIACLASVYVLTSRYAMEEYSELPIIKYIVVSGGILAGLLMLVLCFDLREFYPGVVVEVDGPWRLGVAEFFSQRVSPVSMPGLIVSNMFAANSEPGWFLKLGLFLIVFAMFVFLGRLLFQAYGRPRGKALLGLVLVQIILFAYAVFYSTNLALWLISLLNFWSFFLLVLFMRWPLKFLGNLRHKH